MSLDVGSNPGSTKKKQMEKMDHLMADNENNKGSQKRHTKKIFKKTTEMANIFGLDVAIDIGQKY